MKFLVNNYHPKELWLQEARAFAKKSDIIEYIDNLLKIK
jgi:hypothetical protein